MGDLNRVICIKSDAFYSLLDEVVAHIDLKFNLSKESPWLDSSETMKLLNITSRSTLQKWRDEGKFRYTQTSKKVILFERKSLLEFLEANARNKF
jgi:helix-turn-helix protein